MGRLEAFFSGLVWPVEANRLPPSVSVLFTLHCPHNNLVHSFQLARDHLRQISGTIKLESFLLLCMMRGQSMARSQIAMHLPQRLIPKTSLHKPQCRAGLTWDVT